MAEQNTFTFDQAQEIALEYFKGEEISTSVYLNKYALKDDQNQIVEPSPDMMHKRLAYEFARIDSEKYGLNLEDRYEVYFDAMKNFGRIVPQGSVMAAVGNPYQIMSASNCVVEQSPEDSISGIFRTAHNLAQLYKRRCVAEGSKVITQEHGAISIENVLPGMHILSFDPKTKKTVFNRVLDKFESDVSPEDRVVIRYSNGVELRTSKKHPVLELGEDGFEYIDAGSIKPGSVNVRPEKLDLSALNSGDWDSKITEEHEQAWFVGAHLGDGSADRVVTGDDRGRYDRIRFRISGDNKEVVECYGEIHNRLTGNSANYHESYRKDYQTACWEFSSSAKANEDIAKEWLDNQVGSKTYSAFIPSSIDNDFKMWSFIAGLIDTDGTIKQDGQQIVVSICAKNVIDEVSAFLTSKGVSTHVNIRDNVRENEQTIFRLCIHYEPALWDGIANRLNHDEKRNALRAYEGKPFSLRKPITQSEFDHILSKYSELKKGWKAPSHKLLAANVYYMKNASVRGVGKAFMNQLVDLGFFSHDDASNIMSRVSVAEVVQDTESKKYYDIEVENTNNFYCGNFGLVVIHNCGVGFDLSTLRPEGLPVNNAARSTTGAWSFADLFSDVTRMIGQGGRRGALMITLDVHHPDVVKFATMKHDLTKVTGANVSLRLSDEFLTAVENDTDYEVRWPCNSTDPVIRKRVNARRVWEVIVDSATKSAEPGLIMWTNAVRTLPAHEYPQFKSVSTNPCCFDKDSCVWVVTDTGIKEIKDVKKSDLVWVDSENTWAKTSGYFDAGVADVFRVTLSNNTELFITENHKLEIATKNGRSYDKSLVELKDISVGDLVVQHQNSVDESINLPNIGTKEDGLLMGWLSGDGCLSYRHSDKELPAMFLSFWEGEYDIAEKLENTVSSLGYQTRLSQYTDARGNVVKRLISSTILKDFVEKYDVNPWWFKSGHNPFLYGCSKEFLVGYLSSYFSADGTVSKNPSGSRNCVQLASIDKDRLEQVKNILVMFGIQSHIGVLREAGEADFGIDGKYATQTCYRLTISGYQNLTKFADSIGFISDRKNDLLRSMLDSYARPHTNKLSKVKVLSIEKLGHKPVGCIEVEGYHKFTANGIISGNSEIILSASDSCRLITQNLTAYVRNAFEKDAYFDFEAFRSDAALMAQMGDNLVDLELELIERILKTIRETGTTEDDIKWEAAIWEKLHKAGHDGRRTGLGTHGLADALAQLRLRYDSSEANAMIDMIYANFKEAIYGASIELAKVRGTFPAFDHEVEKDNAFIQALPEEMQKDLFQYGRRNISMLTQAPTGSVSIISKIGEFDMYNVSSGVEPVFRVKYTRRKKVNPDDDGVRVDFRDANGDSWQEYSIFSGNARAYLDKFGLDEDTKLPEFFVSSDEIDWSKRIAVQSTEQKHIDHSISSTINLPAGTPNSVVATLYLEAWRQGLKGVTVYVDGSRDGVLVTGEKQALKVENYLVGHYTEAFDKDAFELWDAIEGKYKEVANGLKRSAIERNQALGNFDWDAAEAVKIKKMNKQDVQDVFASLFTDPDRSSAPRRPKMLPAEVHKIRIDFGDGEPRNAYVTVSFFPGMKRPYEILVQAPYFGLSEKDLQILEVTARSTSMLLRHKVPILFICEQLDKVGGQYLFSLPTNIARVLRSYIDEIVEEETETKDIKDFDRKNAVPMEKCPSCGKRTYRKTGAACGICENPDRGDGEPCTYSGCG